MRHIIIAIVYYYVQPMDICNLNELGLLILTATQELGVVGKVTVGMAILHDTPTQGATTPT